MKKYSNSFSSIVIRFALSGVAAIVLSIPFAADAEAFGRRIKNISPEIEDALVIAKKTSSWDVRDMILLTNAEKALTADDIVALAGEAHSMSTKDKIALAGIKTAKDHLDIIKIAESAHSSDISDKILINGLRFAKTSTQISDLVKAANSLDTKDNIARMGITGELPEFDDTRDLLIYSIIQNAHTSKSIIERDKILMSGIKIAQNVIDFKSLARACRIPDNRDAILLAGIEKAKNVDEIISLAYDCKIYANRDTILIAGVKVAKSPDELARLSRLCKYVDSRTKILETAKRINTAEIADTSQARVQYVPTNNSPMGLIKLSNEEKKKAYEDMMNAYNAYKLSIVEGGSNSEILLNIYIEKRDTYQKIQMR